VYRKSRKLFAAAGASLVTAAGVSISRVWSGTM
jgi:hypothetical protein